MLNFLFLKIPRKFCKNAIVQPYFDYCCPLWINCGKVFKEKLQKYQSRAARGISGGLRVINKLCPIPGYNLFAGLQQLVHFYLCMPLYMRVRDCQHFSNGGGDKIHFITQVFPTKFSNSDRVPPRFTHSCLIIV